MLGLDRSQVRVIIPGVGGGFEAQYGAGPEYAVLGWLARKLGRPVRWVETCSDHLPAAVPTRGIDVGTKAEIQRLVVELSCGGIAVLFISAELEEVLRLSHRIAVLRGLVAALTNDRQVDASVIKQVADQSRRIAAVLGEGLGEVASVAWKPALTEASAIRVCLDDANRDLDCIGVIAWMHTFSPAKMWTAGLDLLRKPLLHLHTQVNEALPWGTIDMGFIRSLRGDPGLQAGEESDPCGAGHR